MANQRNYRFKNTVSKDGTLNTTLSVSTARRVIRYCSEMNLNKTRFVEECVNKRLDELERDLLGKRTKEELIEMILCDK